MADAVKVAYEELHLSGFVPVNKASLEGQALYRRALEVLSQASVAQGGSSDDAAGPPPKKQLSGAAGSGHAFAALADAAGKEGRFLEMLVDFSRTKVDELDDSDERAAEAVRAAAGGSREALQGVASKLEHVVQGLLRGLIGAKPPPDAAANALVNAAVSLKTAGSTGSIPPPAHGDSGSLVAALPAAASELLACRDALGQELMTLCAQVSHEKEMLAHLRRQRDELGRELQTVRSELAKASADIQLAKAALSELQEGQEQQRTELARRVGAAVEEALAAELAVFGGQMAKGLSPACGRLSSTSVSLAAAGSALDSAEAAVHSRMEAQTGEAEVRAKATCELSERLSTARELAGRGASAADAAAGHAAETLLTAAEGLRGMGTARAAAEEAGERLEERMWHYRAGHVAALEEHHGLVREGASRSPLSLFPEFGASKFEALSPEKCTRGLQRQGTERTKRARFWRLLQPELEPCSSDASAVHVDVDSHKLK